MSFFDVLSHRYQLSTVIQGRIGTTHEGLRLLSRPRAGKRLVLYGLESRGRIITIRVVRMYSEPGVDGTFVETGNSLYLLQLERVAAPSHRVSFRSCAELGS